MCVDVCFNWIHLCLILTAVDAMTVHVDAASAFAAAQSPLALPKAKLIGLKRKLEL